MDRETFTLTTFVAQDIKILTNSEGFKVGIIEEQDRVKVKVSGTVSSSGIDPLSGLSNLLTLYNVAKL